jgi:ABC-2 type transport system ATP-binding protein
MTTVIEARELSKWYGNVLGLSDVTIGIDPGITGLLGPNGAGKSTFMKLITGLLKPSRGEILVKGRRAWNNPGVFRDIGFCPELDSFFEEISGWEFLVGLVRLHGLEAEEAEARAARALETVELFDVRNRRIRSYSRGMRQRLKLAQAIAHDPGILILDEPLAGLDPLGKRKMIRLVRALGAAGRTILVSSHVLPEIEALTSRIVLIHQGKILAQGDIHYIRELIDTHPHMISVSADRPRLLAAAFIQDPDVLRVSFPSGPGQVVFETRNRDAFYARLGRVVVDEGIEVEAISSPDDNLQAVFDYLIGK